VPIVCFGGTRIEPFGVARYVAQEMLGMGFKPWARSRGFPRACAQVQRFVEPAEQQTGATQWMVDRAAMGNGSSVCGRLDKLLTFSESGNRRTRLPELGEDPSGGRDR